MTKATDLGLLKPEDLETAAKLVGTTGDPTKEIMLRAQLSEWPKQVSQFINAELEAGTCPVQLLKVLSSIFMSTQASLAGSCFQQTGYDAARQLCGDLYDERFVKHARLVQQAAYGKGQGS